VKFLLSYIYPNFHLLKEIIIAFQGFEDARYFIKKHQLFRRLLLPGIIYTLLFIAGMFLFWHSSDTVVAWAKQANANRNLAATGKKRMAEFSICNDRRYASAGVGVILFFLF
jgi:hypothetical protein